MTVKELIESLMLMPRQAEVTMSQERGPKELVPVTFIENINGEVVLSNEEE